MRNPSSVKARELSDGEADDHRPRREQADEHGGTDVRLNRKEEQGHCAPGLRHFVQPTRLFPRRALLVATGYSAQRPHSARTGGAVRAREKRSRGNAIRESADFSERRFLDVAWSFLWSRRRNAEWIVVDVVRLENGVLAEHWD